MKALFAMVSTILLSLTCIAHAATITLDPALQAALPSGEFFLPAPPAVGSLIWMDDSVKYFQYKEASRVINPETGDRWDSIWAKMNEPYDFALYRLSADSVMNAPFIEASWTKVNNDKYSVNKTRNTTDFPEMNALEQLCELMKEQGTSKLWRTRPRPYFYFSDWYSGQKYDYTKPDKFASSVASSYPSGHGYFAGLFGMAMLYIDPANALAIKKMIDEWAECRLILGAHWNTDIEAGKTLGAITFAIAMNFDQFRNQVEAAKAELEAYRNRPEPEPVYHWFVKGDFDDWAGQAFMSQPEGEANTVYASVNLPAAKELLFKLQGYDTWYSNSGMMTQANHTGWTFGSENEANCAMITTVAGDYIFALDTTTMSLTVHYPDNPKQATLYDTPVKDNNPDIMLQAFYWAHVGNTGEEYTQFGDVKWSALNAEAAEIAANFDLVWLAPSQETADYTGYLPVNYSKQGQVSGNTQGHSPWGSAQDLRNLIDNLHQGGAKVIADIVLNHSSASHPDEYTGPNYNWCTWGTFDFGRYGQFNPNYTWICKGDEMFYDKKNVYGNDCGYNDNTYLDEDEMKVSYKGGETWWAESEFNCMYSRDWAHKKKEVREMSRAFLTWMRDSIGYDGFRYDFMKGIHGSHLNDYNNASAPCFSVAELFDGDIDKQLGFLQDANYNTYVFDFPGKFTIYDAAIREYKLQNLKNNGYTLIYGPYKKYAVTFCDNHDSFHEEGKSLNYHANTIDDRQAHQALAYLLSMPGVPCVMYPYWHNYKAECQAFIMARRAAGVHSESAVVEDWAGSGAEGDNYYTALIQGTNGQLFLKLGYDCNPTDAPMVAAPAGKRWQCAWANRDHAGVWYTVDADTPSNVPVAPKDPSQSSKVLKEGQVLIQQDNQLFTVQGQAL